MDKHLCETCSKKEGCIHYENIKDQPKLTLVACGHYLKKKGVKA